MQQHPLGRSDIRISPLVLGGNVFGWTADEARSFELLDRFVDSGFNTIDTADVYMAMVPGNTGGESETVIGNWLARRGRRDEVVLMTKVGLWDRHKGLRAPTIQAAVEDSLKRLRTDYIDVYFAHLDDPETPLEETLEAFARLVEAGKVRCLGASNYSAERLEQALEVSQRNNLPRYEVLQPHYNLIERRDYENRLADLVARHDIGVVPYFALASGFLTGKYRSPEDIGESRRGTLVRKYLDARGERILAALDEVAEQSAATPAQIALAWLMTRPGISAPIASATDLDQLEEIMGAARVSLSGEMIDRLDAVSA